MTLDEKALYLAEQALQSKFDPEAYIVKHIAETRLKNAPQTQDLVPDSNIDECIQLMLRLFVSYHKEPTEVNLNKFLLVQKQVLSELYHTCSDSCRETMQRFFDEVQTIM